MATRAQSPTRLLIWGFFFALTILLLLTTRDANALTGTPFVEKYTPDVSGFPPLVTVTQDSNGFVYVGSEAGLLIFDGSHWSLLPLPNHDMVRSLALHNNTVFVGGYNTFGYLQRDLQGRLGYAELSEQFRAELKGRDFADIWDIEVGPPGVFFRALRDVFLWDPNAKTARHWTHPGKFGGIVNTGGEVWLQFRGEGFRRYVEGQWLLLEHTRSLTEMVPRVLSLRDGGLLAIARNGKWLRMDARKVIELTMPSGLPDASEFEHGIVLADGGVVLASIGGAVYFLDAKLQSFRRLNLHPGFLTGIVQGFDGALLIAAPTAIYRVPWPSPWSRMQAVAGELGAFLNTAQWQGQDYLLFDGGVVSNRFSAGLDERVRPFWGNQGAYDLFPLDADRALLAGVQKLQMVSSKSVVSLSDEATYPRLFFSDRFNRNHLFLSTEDGLRTITLSQENALPQLSPASSNDRGVLLNSLVQENSETLWFGSERNGAWRYKIDANGLVMERLALDQKMGVAYGKLASAQVIEFDGSLVVSTESGLYRKRGDQFFAEDDVELRRMLKQPSCINFFLDNNKQLWAYTQSQLFSRTSPRQWKEHALRALESGPIFALKDGPQGQLQVISSEAILLFDRNIPENKPVARSVHYSAVWRILADGSRVALPTTPSATVVLSPEDLGIRFEFSLPGLQRLESTQYRGQLHGYESEFSDWSNSAGYSYTRLRANIYTMKVQAKDASGAIWQAPDYPVQFSPQWFERRSNQIALTALLLIALLAIGQIALRGRTRRLQALVTERTQALADANVQLQKIAHLDALTGLPNRRRLDEYLSTVGANCLQQHRALSILIIDVDHFKDYNDKHGHPAGDVLLKLIAQRLGGCLRRAEDLLARYGGEEFLLVMPGAESATAQSMAEAMRSAVDISTIGATVSIGVYTMPADTAPDGASLEQMIAAQIEQADRALYAAKNQGRNRVVVA